MTVMHCYFKQCVKLQREVSRRTTHSENPKICEYEKPRIAGMPFPLDSAIVCETVGAAGIQQGLLEYQSRRSVGIRTAGAWWGVQKYQPGAAITSEIRRIRDY